MDTQNYFINLFLGWKKPGIDKLVNLINSTIIKYFPSDSQLFRFRNYVLSHNRDEIVQYLEQREKKAGSENWYKSLYNEKKLYQLFIEEIITPVTGIKELDKTSDLWGIDFYDFFSHIHRERLDISTHTDHIIRHVLVYIIDMMHLKHKKFKITFKKANSVIQVEHERD